MIPTSEKFASYVSSDAYRDLVARLGPRGKIWRAFDTSSGLYQTEDGYGPGLAFIHGRILDVLDEADPRTTDELIDDWERILGLPDPDDPTPPATLAERRQAAHATLIARRGTQPQILYDIAQAYGYESDVEIQVPTLFRADESASDERAYDWDRWTFVWYVWRLTTPALGWARLLARFNKIKPANTIVIAIDGLRADEVATPT